MVLPSYPQSADDPALSVVVDPDTARKAAEASSAPALTLPATEPTTALSQLTEAQRLYHQDRLQGINVETQVSERRVKEQETGDFWDSLIAEPLDEVTQTFKDTFNPVPEDAAAHRGEVEALLHGLFSSDTVLAGLTANFEQPDVRAIDRLLAAPSSLPVPLERVLGPTAKSQLSTRSCARSVVTASLTTVSKIAVGAVTNAVRAVQAVGATVGFLKNSVANLGPALMNLSAQDLLAIIASQAALCARATQITKLILKLLKAADGAVLTITTGAPLPEVKARLASADAALARLELLLSAGRFEQALWTSAKRDVDAAADLLCSFSVEFDFNLNAAVPPALADALISSLDSVLKIMARQQQLRSVLEINLAGFEIGFFKATRFDNLFAPLIDLIRCRINLICDEIAGAAGVAFFRQLVREKRWCIELRAISAFMRLSNKMQLPDVIDKFTGTAALRTAADEVSAALASARREVTQNDVRRLLVTGFAFVGHARRSVSLRLYSPAAVSLGEALLRELEACPKNDGPLTGLLSVFSAGVATYASDAVIAVSKIMTFAEERNLTQMTESMKQGDVEGSLGVTGLTASLEGSLATSAAQLRNSIPSSQPVAAAKAEQLTIAYADQARAVGLYDELWNDTYSRHIDAKLHVTVPTYQAERKKVSDIKAEITGIYVAPSALDVG